MYKRIILSFDAGSSIVKVIYGWIDEKGKYVVKYMVMGSEHLTLESKSGKYISDLFATGNPEDNAWIRTEKDGEIVLLGRMAREYKAMSRLKPLKVEIMIPKLMAVIGAIAEKENLGNEIVLDLGVLLPYGELESRQELIRSLSKSLKGFYFRDKKITVKLEGLNVIPEASGVASFSSIVDRNEFKKNNRAFLMLGHRNTSLLVFERGSFSPSQSATTNFGFYYFTDRFRQKLPGVQREDILKMIQIKGHVLYNWEKGLHELEKTGIIFDYSKIRGINSKEEFNDAYQNSLEEYWRLISAWLDEVGLEEIQEMRCCGGAVPFVIGNLKKEFTSISIQDIRSEISLMWQTLGYNKENYPKELIEQNLAERLVDVWAYFMVMSDYYEIMEVSA